MSGNVVVLGHVERYLDESSDRRERFVNLSANWPLHVIGNNRLGPVKMDAVGVWDWDIPWGLNIGSDWCRCIPRVSSGSSRARTSFSGISPKLIDYLKAVRVAESYKSGTRLFGFKKEYRWLEVGWKDGEPNRFKHRSEKAEPSRL